MYIAGHIVYSSTRTYIITRVQQNSSKNYYLIMGDTVLDGANKGLFESPNISNYQPWRQVVRGKKTCTADMCITQDVQKENHAAPIDLKDIAEALHKRGLLRSTDSIQISLNGRFCSIKFKTVQLMQTFCTEGLTISENNTIYFKPDYRSRLTLTYTFISFLNVLLETEEKEHECICTTTL